MEHKLTLRGIITLIVIGVLLLIGIGACNRNISVDRRIVDLEASFEAETKVIEGVYSTMTKKIKETAKLTRELTDKETQFFKDYIEGRNENNGNVNMLLQVQENIPNLSSSAYKDLMFLLNTEREKFQSAQKRAIDIEREYKILVNDPINSFFANRSKVLDKGYKMISDTHSKHVMETRIDDEELV